MSEGHTATREAAMAAFAGAGGGSEQAPRAGRLLHDGPGLDTAARVRARALCGLSGWTANDRDAGSNKKDEHEREEAAVREAIEHLISRGPPTGSGIPFEAWRSWHRYGLIVCPASTAGFSF
jgi:hypothetical protein